MFVAARIGGGGDGEGNVSTIRRLAVATLLSWPAASPTTKDTT
jgi:hypothetical protein